MVSSSVCGLVATAAVLTLQGATEISAQDTAATIYVSSFNQFCSGSLPHTDEFYLRKQTKCWICEDLVKGYVKSKAAGDPYMPPAGTDFSPDPRTTYTLGGDFFVFGYDAEGFYQVKPTWNDATQAGWPPPYTCDCKNSYDEDLSSCKSACGGTYTIPPTSERPDDIIGQHDESLTGGGTSYYAEKIEHQYELTALAPQGAFFHGFYRDKYDATGETLFTMASTGGDGTPDGGFVSCAFNDYPWETSVDPASEMLAKAAASAAEALYVSSFNQFCSGNLPSSGDTYYVRQQTKCWICEDTVKSYINSMAAGEPYLPPTGTEFSPDPRTNYILGGDFFVFGYDADGIYQAMNAWNSLSSSAAGWPPTLPDDKACSCAHGIKESFDECKAACGGTYALPPTCTEMCNDELGCPPADGGDRTNTVCRAHYKNHDEIAGGGGTYYYNEKIEHQYELTRLASKGAFFHGQYLDKIDVPGETVFTAPDANGGFVSCSFTDYPWEVADGDAAANAVMDTLDGMFDDIMAGLGIDIGDLTCNLAEMNSDGIVNVQDLLAVLGAFGCSCDGCPPNDSGR